MYAVSPLRYPGAKWRLEKFVHSVLRRNNLEGCHYVEPFAGGASLALSLLFRGVVSEIHLNDLDKSIYSFWYCVKYFPEDLVKLIQSTPVNMESWMCQKEIQKNKETSSVLELGFSTFFLNRTNRSGILKAGVIGGKGQAGKWKIDARYNKDNLVSRVLRVSESSHRIHVYQMDAIEFVRKECELLPEQSFLYFDPPYFVKGGELYLNSYSYEDHQRLSQVVMREVSRPWMVSYDDVPEIRKFFEFAKNTEEPYMLPYSASQIRKGREIFFLSPDLYNEKELIHTSTRGKRAMRIEAGKEV